MKMFVADSLVEKLEAEVNRLYMRGHVAAEHHVQNHALRIVYDEPTVDAEPVQYGLWLNDGSCSVCRKIMSITLNGKSTTLKDPAAPYCPYCGAKMNGGSPHNVGQTTGGAEDGSNNHRPGL